jgi:hypothetical protein
VFKFTAAGKVTSIDGGGAPDNQGDWLDYSGLNVPVTVNLAGGGTAINGVAAGTVTNIQNVHGGNGSDTLIGSALGNILVGGMGADVITGGTGRSLLIADKGAASITGNSDTSPNGGDILIGGTTSFDSDTNAHLAALMSILAEWQSADPYLTRFQNINSGAGGGLHLNGGNYLKWGTTVKDNGVAVVLQDSGSPNAVDWYFTGLKDTYTLESGEHHNNTP